MTAGTDWAMAIGVLLSGLIIGVMFLYTVSRPGRRKVAGVEPDRDVELRDLEGKRDALVTQLRELDDAAAKLPPEELAEERGRLERDAAQVLRSIDRHQPLDASSVDASSASPAASVASHKRRHHEERSGGFLADRPALRGFLWGVLSVGALAFLGYFVFNSSKQRGANDSVTGGQLGTNSMSAAQPAGDAAPQHPPQPPPSPATQALEARVKANPNDLDLRDQLAKAYVGDENLMAAFDQTKYVLARSPKDSRALTYQALVRMAMGQNSDAATMLKLARESDPNLIDASVAMAWLDMQTGAPDRAAAEIEEATRRHPEEKERLAEVLTQMRQHQSAPNANGAAPANAQAENAAPPEAPPADPSQSLAITLDVAPAAKARIPSSAVVFVFARAEGVTSGPPIAVKRLAASGFPMSITLGAADSMMGQPLPAKVRLEARIDADGNPLTKSPDDLAAVIESVAVGGKATLTLK